MNRKYRWEEQERTESNENLTYELYFTPFYDEEKIAELRLSDYTDDIYYLINIKNNGYNGDIFAKTLSEAKERAIEKLIEYFESEAEYYNYLANELKEETP